jgi:hypothetical protein
MGELVEDDVRRTPATVSEAQSWPRDEATVTVATLCR